MNGIIAQIITDYGVLGIILVAVGYLVWDAWQTRKDEKASKKEYYDEQTKQWNYMKELSNGIEKVTNKLEEHMRSSHNANVNMPQMIADAIQAHDQNRKEEHDRQLSTRAVIAPQLHAAIRHYKKLINSDHICLGSFHNGNHSVCGIPYFKFDIVAENIAANITQDVEFAPIYKDVDITRHDRLPSLLFQDEMLYYKIDEDGNSELENVDDIIYRRMIGRKIKQFAIHILKDLDHTCFGFIAAIKYDYEEMDLDELKNCANRIERIYNSDILGEIRIK